MTKVLRGFAALLVVCLLFGFTAAGVTASIGDTDNSDGELTQTSSDRQLTVIPNTNTTNYLSPVDPETDEYAQVSVDASSAATLAAAEIHSEHDNQVQAEQLAASDEENRSAVAEQQLDDIELTLEQIATRQEELFEAYSNDEIGTRTLLKNLVKLQIRAETEAEKYERAEQEADISVDSQSQVETLVESLSRLETLVEAMTVDQPVTDRIERAFTETGFETTVYLQGSQDGLVLGTVDDDTHIRQATLPSERDFDGQDQFKLDQNISRDDPEWFTTQGYVSAQNRLAELYPWAYDLRQLDVDVGLLTSRVYQLRLSHPQGELQTYFDGATKNVFHENQLRTVTAVPMDGPVTNSTDSVTVSVGLTHDSGPLRVTVEDDGGSVADATVEINGQTVGSTNTDGQLWTVQPHQNFEVTVTTTNGESVTVSFP